MAVQSALICRNSIEYWGIYTSEGEQVELFSALLTVRHRWKENWYHFLVLITNK
jgi:hypothetical protein